MPSTPTPGTTVHVLGSGTPTPTRERFGSAFAVEVGGSVVMVDCGPAATAKLVRAGLWPTNVTDLFFTHHHFDHDVDYPCLLLTRWDQSIGAEEDLRVFGPQPTIELTDQLIGENGAFAHDWRARINAPPSQHVFVNRGGVLPRRPPVVQARDIEAGYTHRAAAWSMHTAHAQHVQPYLDSIAYRLETPDGAIVFTGDTEPCGPVRELAAGADLMFCMCWDTDANMAASGENTGQCGMDGAARMAADAGVKRLVLVHTGPDLSTHGRMETALARLGQLYDGTVIFADELMTIHLGEPGTAQTPP